jgi:hypothetical protein
MSTEEALNRIDLAQADVTTAGEWLVTAQQHLDAARSALTADPDPLPEPPDPDPDPTPDPPVGRWETWTEPPRVSVPVLAPGTTPVIPIPGTLLQVRFTAPLQAKSNGASCQMEYEHATAAPVMTDPLVSPGNGSHPHEYWGNKLPDTVDLERLWAYYPAYDEVSPMDRSGGEQTWAWDIQSGLPVGHQPGLWHPAMHAKINGQWVRCQMGRGSALNYVRDNAAHNADERLFLPPNGVGWVSFDGAPRWKRERNPAGTTWRWRWSIDGPTWMNRQHWVGPWDDPQHRQVSFGFGRPDWANGAGVPLAEVQVYIKSPTLAFDTETPLPPIAWGMPGADIEPHIDYVGGSVPMAVDGGNLDGVAPQIIGPAPDGWTGPTILFGQWMLDMTINAGVFGNPAGPLYGRWRVEVAT